MRHPLRNMVLIIGLLAISLLAIFPVEENLRLGRDLAGGVSLTYTVDLDPKDPPDVMDRTIEVLKERVNPAGVLDIQFVQQGRDRLEITMPLPTERVKALRQVYEEELAALRDFNINVDAFERALRLGGDERAEALEELISNAEVEQRRRELLQPVLDAAAAAATAREAFEARSGAEDAAMEALRDAQAAFNTAVQNNASEEELTAVREARNAAEASLNQAQLEIAPFSTAAAEAEIALDEARQRVLRSTVNPEEMRRALELSDEKIIILDSETDEQEVLPSRREEAVEAIRDRIGDIADGDEVINDIIEAHEVYAANRRSLDDPSDLVRLLQGAGVLEFRIAVTPGRFDEDELREELRDQGPERADADDADWFPLHNLEGWYQNTAELQALINNPGDYFLSRNLIVEKHGADYYALLHTTPGERLTEEDGDWSLASAYQTSDELGRPAVGFRMDPRGAVMLGQLTEANKQRPMAILLDDKVYSAPNINSQISRSGIIQGNFSQSELSYLIKTMSAGSLSAKLSSEPISVNILAPELGAENLARGLEASWVALVAVGVFMVIYYFNMGFIAMFALICNAVLILAAMSLNRAAFTLPGIAGIVLTFGMAVDANVLIYERVREELFAGNDLRTSVRLAYQKVFSTIIDANVTNLIVCFVLAYFGTQEIKGFAITLGIGIVATLFSSLIITRIIFTLLIEKVGVSKMRQLPMVVPFIQNIMSPNIKWISLRHVFWIISLVAIGASFTIMAKQGAEMLDTEFRGGTEITLQLDDESPLTRAEVGDRIAEIYNNSDDIALTELAGATIVVVNPDGQGRSNTFKVKTTITDDLEPGAVDTVTSAIVDAFGDLIESTPALDFAGVEADRAESAPVFPIYDRSLGGAINRPAVQNDVSQYIGGVAIVLENISPPVSKEDLQKRLDAKRDTPDFSSTLARPHDIILLEGTPEAVTTAVLVVQDPAFDPVVDPQQWESDFAQQEWELVNAALATASNLTGVQEFSPVIAASFRAKATVAVALSLMLIMIYIWVRFGAARYSLAAITALIHDVIIALGLIALAEILYESFPGLERFGILPYKINLGLVAAVLTIIGYSLNDTIVILDRIRENRGKLAYASENVVNTSINQTLSRTLVTSSTTLLALIVMFVFGGEAISSFTYALICGVIVGTYSSVAVAAPLVFSKKIPPSRPYGHTPDAEDAKDPAPDLATA